MAQIQKGVLTYLKRYLTLNQPVGKKSGLRDNPYTLLLTPKLGGLKRLPCINKNAINLYPVGISIKFSKN